jgi:hypothetical protein
MAIFSNDPNIGIKQMGYEQFIPTPVSSITYKGNAGMNAKRAGSYLNTPRSNASFEAAKESADAARKAAEQRKQREKVAKMNPAQKAAWASGLVSSMFGMPMPKAPRPTITTPSSAQIADRIQRLQDTMRVERGNRWPWEKQDQRNAADVIGMPSNMFGGASTYLM